MKQFSTFLNGVLASILVCILLFSVLPNTRAQAAESTAKPTVEPQPVCNTGRSIQVSGTAVVNIVPDRALIQLGVQSNATTTKAVEAANTTTIRRVIKALEARGISSSDISTDRYIIQPLYDNYDSLHIIGYRIDNIVAITLRDVDKASQIIAAALDAGANQVVDVQFYTSELRKYRDQARDMAVTAALEKAQDLASAAGAGTGCVLNINENSWSYYNGGWYGRNNNLWTQNAVQNVPSAGTGDGALTDSGPVNLGHISVRAEVSITVSLT